MTNLSDEMLRDVHDYWRAANYLTVGQIYLLDNPLLREPLRADHIKPRLLGHWGTSPGLSLIYAHLQRVIRERDVNVVYLAGPGHGGPAMLANVYLEGAYAETYPAITEDAKGMKNFFRQFSTPGGVPSHVGPTTPGSIHEGGELGYVLTHAFGAVFDNPDLIAVAVVGDGEAETGPLEGSWKGIKFIDPKHDGAVLPILHLNGYKISGPTVLGREGDEQLRHLFLGHGYDPIFVEGSDPKIVHQALANALNTSFDRISKIQQTARTSADRSKLTWPLIVLRTLKGWTGPKELDGVAIEGTFRSHQVPLTAVRTDAKQLAMLESWMKSYRAEELFDDQGKLIPRLQKFSAKGPKRMGANPHANGGKVSRALEVPNIDRYEVKVDRPGTVLHESTRALGELLRDVYSANPTSFRLFCPDETNSNRLGAVFEVENRCSAGVTIPTDDHVSPAGRVMEVLSEHNCEGWLEGYLLTGRHGIFATYEAFALVVASMTTQHAKWLEMCGDLEWRAPIPSLNILLTSTCWRNDHNGFSHQGPGFMDTLVSKKATVARVYFPPDANCLLSVSEHCLKSHDYVNLIIIDKQPELQWLNLQQAKAHCADGAGVWEWASNCGTEDPDIVLACAGDTATLETIAAAAFLREHTPDLRVRVVNIVDFMTLFSPSEHPHGMNEERFAELFTKDTDVVFAFHGYPGAVHPLLHGRPNASRFHVRGYQEEGSTTTPFDMVVRNHTSRFHLALEALKRAPRRPRDAKRAEEACNKMLERHHAYVLEHFDDMPEVRDFRWIA